MILPLTILFIVISFWAINTKNLQIALVTAVLALVFAFLHTHRARKAKDPYADILKMLGGKY